MRTKASWFVVSVLLLILSLPTQLQAAAGETIVGRFMTIPFSTFNQGESIEIQWHNAPGHAQDWITVTPANAPDKEWGTWKYLRGQSHGTHQVTAHSPGRYEARIYWNWPNGGYKVIERLEFEVLPAAGSTAQAAPAAGGEIRGRYITVPQAVFPVGQVVEVLWHNAPGHAQDWITVAHARSSDKKWGRWIYLKGMTSGVHRVSGLAAGRYEARIYWNWPKGRYKVMERIPFEVR